MSQITAILVTLILIPGLVSCNRDNSKTEAIRVWKIKEPKVQTEEGESLPFTQFNRAQPRSLKITEEITFSDISPNTQVKIKSLCHEGDRSVQDVWVRNLEASIPIRQLIPMEIYHNVDLPIESENQLMHCQIHFTAISSEGSTHSFEFKDIKIFGTHEEDLVSFTSHSIVEPGFFLNASLEPFYADELAPYLFCDQFQIPLKFQEDIKTILREKYDMEALSPILQNSIQKCRVILSKNRYAQFLSKTFSLQFPVSEPQIDQQLSMPQSYKLRRPLNLEVQRVLLYNPHPIPLHLFIPQIHSNTLIYTPTGRVTRLGSSSDFEYVTHFDIQWDTHFFVTKKKNGFSIQLPPQQGMRLTISAKLPRLQCLDFPVHEGLLGRSESGMWIQISSDFLMKLIEPKRQGILKSYSLKIPRTWIGARLEDPEHVRIYKRDIKRDSEGRLYYKPVEIPHRNRWRALPCKQLP